MLKMQISHQTENGEEATVAEDALAALADIGTEALLANESRDLSTCWNNGETRCIISRYPIFGECP